MKVGDLIEWPSLKTEAGQRTTTTLQGIIISIKEYPSHLHQPGRKGVTSGTMLEVLFKENGIEWVSANQCRIISEIDEKLINQEKIP